MTSSTIAQWQRMLEWIENDVRAAQKSEDSEVAAQCLQDSIDMLRRDMQQAYLDKLREENR